MACGPLTAPVCELSLSFECTTENQHNYFKWVLSTFRMTIEISTMGSDCNLQTCAHTGGDFFAGATFSADDDDDGSYPLLV